VIEDNSVALHLYRIAQEAVHNAVKHADPTAVLISLTSQNNKLKLKIEDDGIGLQEKALNKKGMGLHIIQYRCNIINGKLAISGQQKGTVIECT
jgi:signal transduction histidine kinase